MPKFHVQRSIEIDAPPQQVFDTVADFGSWTAWSPWLCAEPTADVTVTDNPNSVGSIYAWKGEVVGQNQSTAPGQQHTDSVPVHVERRPQTQLQIAQVLPAVGINNNILGRTEKSHQKRGQGNHPGSFTGVGKSENRY